jgi:hypothetical protein
MNNYARWPTQAFLDGLRPEFGWSVTSAMIASYSADLPSIGAALLALTALDNEGGRGNKTDLAEAVERLRGKVRIIIQRGRLARPKQIPPIAGILDQFLREVPFDERVRSWHPKVSLVHFVHPEGGSMWRLWLGSRNLTSIENRDIGLLLSSDSGSESRNVSPIPGIGDLAQRLAQYAELDGIQPVRLKAELDRCRWLHPAKMQIENVQLTFGDGRHKAPSPPTDIEDVILISPFLDGSLVGKIGQWGGANTKRILLSTLSELAKISGQTAKPLSGFAEHVLALDAPPAESSDPSIAPADEEVQVERGESANQEEARLGLHAKIIAVRKAKQLRLWIGSANATQRAWTGRNVEVIAEITADVSFKDGLLELVGQAHPVSPESLEGVDIKDTDEISKRLDRALKEVVGAWTGELTRDGDDFTISCEGPPHPQDSEIKLEAGLATGELTVWPRGAAQLSLGVVSRGLQTELLQLRLSLGVAHCVWMQRVPVSPPLEAGRDHAALAHHLGARVFLDWIAALMDGGANLGSSDEAWDQPTAHRKIQETTWFDSGLLSLEAMLACWARDPNAFFRADARLKAYLDPIIAQAEEEQSEYVPRLHEFRTVWQTVGSELMKSR